MIPTLQAMKDQIDQIALAGYYVALRVGFSFPEEEVNRLPDGWVEHYTTHGLVVHDPAMKWVYANSGGARFSELDFPDPYKVMPRAANYGLDFGAVVSVNRSGDHGKRSYGLFFRGDREFETDEIGTLERIIRQLHGGVETLPDLTAAEIEALRMQSAGLRLKQIAGELGISESAVKARLNNAKRKLGAKTLSQAASIAASKRMLAT